MTAHELPRPLSAKYTEDFAYPTLKDRLPVILTKAVDTVYRLRPQVEVEHGQKGIEDLKLIAGGLSKLRSEMQTNKPLLPIANDGTDVGVWNNYLEHQRTIYRETQDAQPQWYSVPWLYYECYAYRRIVDCVRASTLLRDLDPFEEQKRTAFQQSLTAVDTLIDHLSHKIGKANLEDPASYKLLFEQLMLVCLWGNKCDLSISAGKDNSQVTNPLSQLQAYDSYILVNNIQAVWNVLLDAKMKHPGSVLVHIVLDNAGFELMTDLIFAEFLMAVKLVDKICFHGKAMPWFVSDVTQNDWDWTLEQLINSASPAQVLLGKKIKEYVSQGKWTITYEDFWTLPYAYCDMKEIDAQLYENLAQADIILFKGDLNYRKLVQDRKWPTTSEFDFALGGFNPAPLCALRTLKADTVVGLSPGQQEECKKHLETWMTSGDYAVVQFSSLKS